LLTRLTTALGEHYVQQDYMLDDTFDPVGDQKLLALGDVALKPVPDEQEVPEPGVTPESTIPVWHSIGDLEFYRASDRALDVILVRLKNDHDRTFAVRWSEVREMFEFFSRPASQPVRTIEGFNGMVISQTVSKKTS
jgi:hypothetical protein